MADREVLTLNETTKQIEAAQSGDVYLVPRNLRAQAGVVLDETATHNTTPTTGRGEFWVRSSDGAPMFTDRAGVQYDLSTGGGGGAADSVELQVRNESGSTITSGSAVHIAGWNTGLSLITIDLADADVSGEMPALGVVNADIANNATGTITLSGIISGLDTSAWSQADPLYVSTTPGALTNTRPSDTDELVQKVGIVLRSHASAGVVQIVGAGRTNDTPNSAGTDFPPNPREGDRFYHTVRHVIYVRKGSAWEPVQSFADITLYLTAAGAGTGDGWSLANAASSPQDILDAIPPLLGGNVLVECGAATATTIAGDWALSGKTFTVPGRIHFRSQMISQGAAVSLSSITNSYNSGSDVYGVLLTSGSTIPDADFYTFPSKTANTYWVAKRTKPAATSALLAGINQAGWGGIVGTVTDETTITFRSGPGLVGGDTVEGFNCATAVSGTLTVTGVENVFFEGIDFTNTGVNSIYTENSRVQFIACKRPQSSVDLITKFSGSRVGAYGCHMGRFDLFEKCVGILVGTFLSSDYYERTLHARDSTDYSLWSSTVENTHTTTTKGSAVWTQLLSSGAGSNNAIHNKNTLAGSSSVRASNGGGVKNAETFWQCNCAATGDDGILIEHETGGWTTTGSSGVNGFADDAFAIANAASRRKRLMFDCSPITAATDRTWTVPDGDIDFTGQENNENGTWNPVVQDTSGNDYTMDSNNTMGRYTRIGDVVYCTARLGTSSKGSASGSLRIKNLPFTAATPSPTVMSHSAVSIGWAVAMNLPAAGRNLGGYVIQNATNLTLQMWNTTGGTAALTDAEWPATGQIMINFFYFVD